jgi:phage tail-like protein
MDHQDPTVDPAVSVCFVVSFDDIGLGAFNSCEGLGCEVVIEQREEGGNNGFVWQLPTRIKYPNIKLSRPLTKDTETVTKWLAKAVQGGGKRSAEGKKTGIIKAMRADGKVVASWGLLDVVPVRWTGPSLNPDSPKVATETLEVAHHGFVTEPSPRQN